MAPNVNAHHSDNPAESQRSPTGLQLFARLSFNTQHILFLLRLQPLWRDLDLPLTELPMLELRYQCPEGAGVWRRPLASAARVYQANA